MKVRVKLFGTFPQTVQGYDAETGLDIKLPDGARICDLLAHLEIPETDGYMVTIDNIVKRPVDVIKDGVVLSILPCLAGG